MRKTPLEILFLFGFSLVAPLHAQFAGVSGAGDIAPTVNQAIGVDQDGAAGPSMQSDIPNQPDPKQLRPFGHNLFTGGFAGEREDGLNPNYRVTRGDVIDLRIWGAIEVTEQLTVDPQGNIFIPKVGPVTVEGVRNDQLNARVTNAIRDVFTENVQVYTSLNGTQPVAVFVTGFVNNPGRFAGVASNSVLFFIDRAAGIDPDRGSYRDIRLMRNGKTIAKADLYKFLLSGKLPTPQLRDGDTILVGERGKTVAAFGDVRNSYVFEFQNTLDSNTLLTWARPLASASHMQWRGLRNGEPLARYFTVDELKGFLFQDGDELEVFSDARSDVITVSVEGAFEGPSQYVLPRHFTLSQMLDLIPVDVVLANSDGISLRRVSVAERQKQSLEDSLRRLESTYLLAASATDEGAQIRTREVQMITEFVKRARQIEPNGRLILGADATSTSLLLEEGDVVTIPQVSQTILVSGEVLLPQALMFDERLSVEDYVTQSGGYNEQANPEKVMIVRQNGQVFLDKNVDLMPGDQVMVLPKVSSKNLQVAKSIVDVIYKVAIAAGVLINI